MRAALGMPEGRAKLAQLLEQFPDDHPHWSEAENRFQFIDEFMKECLGWQKPDMHVEVSQEGGGRSDYELGTPAKGILEAKKPALVWTEVPDASKKKLRSIEALCFSSPEFAAAASQILPYCVRKGAPLAVICNGPQMAIFQGITIGNEPLKGDCFFFNGFNDYLDNFALIWNLLSPEAVTENRALPIHQSSRKA